MCGVYFFLHVLEFTLSLGFGFGYGGFGYPYGGFGGFYGGPFGRRFWW